MRLTKRGKDVIAAFGLLILLAAFCGYKGYKSGYRNGLIHAALQFQMYWLMPKDH